MDARSVRVCVFCGSSPGASDEYSTAAKALGKAIARQGATLVYGGGSAGVMGVLARTVLEASSKAAVEGVVPELYLEAAGELIGTTNVVKTVGERKALMLEGSDVFVALPGGPGTLEEIAEILIWQNYNYEKPVGLLNTRQYYSKLLEFLDCMVQEGFMRPQRRDALVVSENAEELISRLLALEPLKKSEALN